VETFSASAFISFSNSALVAAWLSFGGSCAEANEEQKATVTAQTPTRVQRKKGGGNSFIANHPSDLEKGLLPLGCELLAMNCARALLSVG
jgi:hypothetical protein